MFLKLEIIKKIIGLILLIVSLPISVMAIAWSLLISGILSVVINAWPNRKLLGYSVEQQILDILPNIIMAGIMGVVVYGIGSTPVFGLSRLLIQILTGAVIYYLESKITKNETFLYLESMARKFIAKRKAKNTERGQ